MRASVARARSGQRAEPECRDEAVQGATESETETLGRSQAPEITKDFTKPVLAST